MKDLEDVSVKLDAVALACHLDPHVLREAIGNYAIQSVVSRAPTDI